MEIQTEAQTVQNVRRGLKEATTGCRLSMRTLPLNGQVDSDQKSRIADLFEADDGSVRAGKVIINRSIPEVKEVLRIQRAARDVWKSYTIPYESGVRLIRTDRVAWIQGVVDEIRNELTAAVQRLAEVWSTVNEEAQARLGELYNPADYAFDVTREVEILISFPAIEPDRRLLQIAPEIYSAERERLAKQFAKIAEDTQAVMEAEFAEMVQSIAERLNQSEGEDGKKKIVQQRAIDGIVEFANQWKAKSINPSAIDSLIEQAEQLASGVDMKSVRKQGSQKQLSQAFAELAKQAGEMITSRKSRAFDL